MSGVREAQRNRILTESRHHLRHGRGGIPRLAQLVKNLPANAGDVGSIPGSGRAPGGGNGNPLQYSCLRNPMERGAWQATVQGVAESQTRLSD